MQVHTSGGRRWESRFRGREKGEVFRLKGKVDEVGDGVVG